MQFPGSHSVKEGCTERWGRRIVDETLLSTKQCEVKNISAGRGVFGSNERFHWKCHVLLGVK